MDKDFYLPEHSLASYFEKDWGDHFIESAKFKFAPFEPARLYSDYHERLVDFIASDGEPGGMLEVGSSLGRTFYEACKKIKSLKAATLVEPSQNLLGGFNKIFNGDDVVRFSILKGNVDFQEAAVNAAAIRAACSNVAITTLNLPFQKVTGLGKFELVMCSNVLDQCHDPLRLVEFLKEATAHGGRLALSCTYQWQEKYLGNATEQIENITSLFGEGWSLIGETNIPFAVRKFERHWMTFHSHVAVFQKY